MKFTVESVIKKIPFKLLINQIIKPPFLDAEQSVIELSIKFIVELNDE